MVTVGIDVGGTKCLGVLLDDDGRVVVERRAPTPETGAALVEVLADVVAGLTADRGGGTGHEAVGVGLPGLVDRQGVLRAAPNLPGAIGLKVAAELSAHLGGASVAVDNDATCAAWAEFRMGAAQGRRDVLVVTLGTGIGGGLICGGRLVRGANGFAGEVGHMVVNPGGPQCPCGRRGCWERYASGSGLGRLARERARLGAGVGMTELAGSVEAIRGEHVGVAAAQGDEEALDVIASLGRWVALGLANLVSIIDPATVVVGGGLVVLGDALLTPVREELTRLLEMEGRPGSVEVLAALLGERAGAMGAAALARSPADGHP